MIVGWTCRKQIAAALSIMEAEFSSASHEGQELLKLRELLTESEYKIKFPMSMEINNQRQSVNWKMKKSRRLRSTLTSS